MSGSCTSLFLQREETQSVINPFTGLQLPASFASQIISADCVSVTLQLEGKQPKFASSRPLTAAPSPH
ncbi:hypothetical protein XELAEV_18036421mg [Xenopus laevis]|uniref:Uncharacterized protein n=1 Tax=Xenopus laevis TaxID=8355 RepID=A0A974HD17_XENLA|nr:hypothetical protein XELAEV_18036421mg [Xenopus laevis]